MGSAVLRRHDFTGAPYVRSGGGPLVPLDYLRGIISGFESRKRMPQRARAFFADHHRECQAHLDACGLSLEQAKALVFPEPEKLPKAIRRAYGLRARRSVGSGDAVDDVRACADDAHADATGDDAATESDAPPTPPERPCGADGLPFVLYAEDLARLFCVSVATARRHLAAGDYGKRLKLGRRWAIRAAALTAHLEALEERPRCGATRWTKAWEKRVRDQRRRPRRTRA